MRHRSNRPKRMYAAIPNAAMRDANVSIEARGMLALLMTYADDWVFNSGHLMEISGMGRDKFQRVMRELSEAGYIARERLRQDDGRVCGTTWVIVDEPEVSPEKSKQEAADREPEFPVIGGHREPEKPTAGFSGSIRRTTSSSKKNKNVGHCENREKAFDAFIAKHPRPRDPERSRKLFEEAVESGVDPNWIVASAERYAGENVGQKPMYICYSDNWLNDRRWRDYPQSDLAQDVSRVLATARMWAGKVRSGARVPSSAFSTPIITEILRQELLTMSELRRAGADV